MPVYVLVGLEIEGPAVLLSTKGFLAKLMPKQLVPYGSVPLEQFRRHR